MSDYCKKCKTKKRKNGLCNCRLETITDELFPEIEKAKSMLKNTKDRLKKLRKIPLLERGHIDNEDLLKLEFREKQLKSAIKLLKKKKPITNKDIIKMIRVKKTKKDRDFNGEYF